MEVLRKDLGIIRLISLSLIPKGSMCPYSRYLGLKVPKIYRDPFKA